MDNSTNYQCPACSGPLRFDATLGMLKCDHCESTYRVEQIQRLYEEQNTDAAKAAEQSDWNNATLNNNWGEDAAHMRAYGCTSCGAEIICDDTTAATSCLYCGNNTVVPGQFAGALRPDYVIPFKLTKDDAKNALKKHCKGKYLLPKFFTQDLHIEEIKGVYVPVWLFDGAVDADVRYKASNSSSTTSGNYRTTTTKHYDVHRTGRIIFEDIPVDSSSKMPDEYMESIEPYDYSELKPFSMAYMPGFLADKYDVSLEQCAPRADSRAVTTALALLRRSVEGYDKCNETSNNTNLIRGEVRYAMTPVWLLTTRWRGKVYLFAMNGQTGQFAGNLPCDMLKYFASAIGLTSLGTVAIYAIIAFLAS